MAGTAWLDELLDVQPELVVRAALAARDEPELHRGRG